MQKMNQIKLLISREYGEKETLGYGVVFDGSTKVFEFVTIELPNKGNQNNISCIPEGEYNVHKIISPSKGKCFQVMDVPERIAILIHIGNYATGKKVDTQGCILPGNEFIDINDDGNIDVAGSTDTLKKLLQILPDNFKLTII
jgi:hypothetical protein